MNKYTQDFHTANFPGYAPSVPWQWDPETFWFREDIPWIELPIKFDTGCTADFLARHHDSLFDEITEQKNNQLQKTLTGRDWFAVDHQSGWQQCALSRDNYPPLANQITGTGDPLRVIQPKLHAEVCVDLIDNIRKAGIHIAWADVKSLKSGGWIQPHRDPKITGTSMMEYFWLPLNDCTSNFKFWPVGYLAHKKGHLYLANNQTWLHSVWNSDPWTRYVLVGRIDRHRLGQDLLHMIRDSMREQWFDNQ